MAKKTKKPGKSKKATRRQNGQYVGPETPRTVTINGSQFALPFANLFRPLSREEAKELRESIGQHGVRAPVLVYESPTHGPAVIDGVNRATIGEVLNVPIPVTHLGKMIDDEAEELAATLNIARRHLSQAEQQQARAARLKRVAESRAKKQSIRSIARQEGVSPGQVQRDLRDATASGVSGDTPAEVVGLDGKTYQAERTTQTKDKPATGVFEREPSYPRSGIAPVTSGTPEPDPPPVLSATATHVGEILAGTAANLAEMEVEKARRGLVSLRNSVMSLLSGMPARRQQLLILAATHGVPIQVKADEPIQDMDTGRVYLPEQTTWEVFDRINNFLAAVNSAIREPPSEEST